MRRPGHLIIALVVLSAALVSPVPARGQVSRDERRGLIFDGLRRRPAGPCGRAFELVAAATGQRTRCTHGPDPAPADVDVRQRRQFATPAPLPGPGFQAAAQAGIPCYGNGTDGYRVQVLYAYRAGTPNRLTALYSNFATWTAGANTVFKASAAKTGGTRQIRLVTDPSCALVITPVQVSTAAMNDFGTFVSELQVQGIDRTDRKYLVYADANAYCGIGEVYDDDAQATAPGLVSSNANNANPLVPGTFARVDNGCWGMTNSVEAHELVHVMGGVQPSASNATEGFHCTDDSDRLCYLDGTPPGSLFQRCTGANDENRLDCNNDDYYSTSPIPGSYLATHWNVATSAFLAATDPPVPIVGTGGPKQFTALVGYGSGTTQHVMNALAGESNGISYRPIQSSAATGQRQIASWDAGGGLCVTPKAPGATISRPRGSTAGRRALSRAVEGTNYGNSSCGASSKPVSGLVDFARSSVGPAAGDTGTDLTYLPFARDGLSFAYYADGVAAPVTALTRAQLTSLFTAGPQTINGVNIIPCGIQTSSGIYSSWNAATTGTGAQEATATATCNAAGNGARLQENDAAGLKAKGEAQVGSQVIVGFSAASFISQANLVAPSPPPAGVDLGSISNNGSGVDLGRPYQGAAPGLSARSTFYGDVSFGRSVYNVFDSSRINGIGENDLKTLFLGSESAICGAAAQATINAFGFLSIASCGSAGLTGSLVAGSL